MTVSLRCTRPPSQVAAYRCGASVTSIRGSVLRHLATSGNTIGKHFHLQSVKITYHGVSVEMANSLNPGAGPLGAYFCLLAALLLYAPLAGAAWSAHSMACCTGDHCPIRGHHHQKPAASHEDCEHELGMSSCSMSCCQDEEKTATSALVFVLPDAQSLAALIPVVGASVSQIVLEIPRPARPVSPPPRTSPAIA